jgi:tryptophanyl-tRNA synthetase
VLSDDPAEAAKKIMRAETDSVGKINWDWQAQPGVTNLMQILELLTATPHETIIETWQGQSRYGDLKQAVATAVRDWLSDFQSHLAGVDDGQLEQKLAQSEAAMNEVALKTLGRVQRAVGVRPQS